MKRQLSLVLALVMILGSFSTVFAAMPETANEKATFLAEKGILKGNLEGDLNLTQDLKRRDALVVLSRLFDVEDEAKAYPAEDLAFVDITDAYYAGFIAWAVEEGYTDGKTETIYDPNGPLTAQQFATFLLRALQYQENGENIFDKAFEEATELGILEDVEVEKKDTVKRADMAAMTFNALGVKVKGTEKTLAETLGIEMPAPDKATDLKVEKVYTDNLAEVEIELSNVALANKARLENKDNYTIVGPNKEKVTVYNAEIVGDNVRLTLVPYGRTDKTENVKVLLKDRKYDLTIRNVDKAINEKKQPFTALDNAIPTVESVDFIGDYGIKVVTSEPIRDAQERFFRVDDKRTSMFIEQYGRTLILSPYQNGSFDKDAKDLVIGKLEDFSDFRAIEKTHDLELAKEDIKPVVKNVYRAGATLLVEFEEDIFHKSINAHTTRRNLGNVSFMDGRVSFYSNSAVKVDERLVRYTFEREIPRNVEVEIVDVENHFRTKMDKVSKMPELIKDESIPYIIDPVKRMNTIVYTKDTLSKDGKTANAKIELVFDKEDMTGFVDKDGNVNVKDLKEHFALYEIEISKRNEVSELITAATVEKDTVTVYFEGIKVQNKNNDNDYVLEVKRFQDKAGNRMETTYVDFEVDHAPADFDVTKLEVISSDEYRSSIEIKLTFNRALDKEEAERVNNYYLGANGTGRAHAAYLEKDGKTVSLLIRDKTVAQVRDMETLEISSNVKNTGNTATVANRFWDLVTERPVGEVKEDEMVKAVETLINALPAVDKIELENEDAVVAARKAYDALTAVQKELVKEDVLDALKAAEAKIAELKEEKEDEKEADVVLADEYVFELYGSSLGGFFQGKLVDNNNVVKDFSGYTIEIEEYGKANVSADGTIDVDITVDFVLSLTGQSVLTVFDADGNLVGEGIEILKTN